MLVLGGKLQGLTPLLLLVLVAFSASRAHLHDPPETLLLRDRHGTFLGEIGSPTADGYGYWPVGEALPDRVVAATLALEDHRFRQHPGVDPLAVARAVRQNLAAGTTLSGASTLAMQVARMQDPGPRTLPRKVVEAVTAVLLTARYGRDAILAQYLRLAPYGNNIHGIAYAARRYLDKPVSDLSWAETAFLCALPQAPSRTNPFDPKGRARAVERATRILDHLYAEGLLSDDERQLAQTELRALRIPDKGRRPAEALHVVLHLGRTLDRDVPLVDSTLDLALQKRVTTITRGALAEWAGAPNAAVMVVDRATGEVHASVGSADYDDTARAGAFDYTRTVRSPGSTLKPFLYALALDRGVITPATVLDDIGRGPDGIENADAASLGPLLPRQALANSRNVPAVHLLDRIGLEEGYAFLRELGLHSDALPARHYGLGLAIGGLPVTLEGLVTAYTALAGDGRLQPLVWRRGAPTPPTPRLLSVATARRIALYLSDPMARLPSFPRMGATEYPFPVAVKTGTSADYRDAWTMAWSSRWLVGVWVGDPTSAPMARLGGFSAAAEVVQQVLLHLHPDEGDGLADLTFPPPPGQVPVRVCATSGHRAGDACPRAVNEWFTATEVPTDGCTAHGGVPIPAVALRNDTPVVRIVAPKEGQHVVRDPEAPEGHATLALEARVDPPVPQVLWYVDGEPFAVVDAPYSVRWPLAPGEHRFEARVPFTPIGSKVARVTVQ